MRIRVLVDGHWYWPHVHLVVHHEEEWEGGPEEGPIDAPVHTQLWLVNVLTTRTIRLDSVLSGNVGEPNW